MVNWYKVSFQTINESIDVLKVIGGKPIPLIRFYMHFVQKKYKCQLPLQVSHSNSMYWICNSDFFSKEYCICWLVNSVHFDLTPFCHFLHLQSWKQNKMWTNLSTFFRDNLKQMYDEWSWKTELGLKHFRSNQE